MSTSGTEQNPYIVTTWAELVSKAAENGKYTKLGNDIDAMAEFPNGNIPQLVVKGNVDGDGHTINGVYNTESKTVIAFNASEVGILENTNFTNVNTSYSLINGISTQDNVIMRNCKFGGKMQDGYILQCSEGSQCGLLSGCSFNIKGGNLHFCYCYGNRTHSNCNIKMDTTATWLVAQYQIGATATFLNCYLDINAPNITEFTDDSRSYVKFDNTVLDLTTAKAVPIRVDSNSGVSIFNSDHAPNITESGNVKGVSTANWLNVSHLQSIGFDIVG